jgi:hypothetical protein
MRGSSYARWFLPERTNDVNQRRCRSGGSARGRDTCGRQDHSEQAAPPINGKILLDDIARSDNKKTRLVAGFLVFLDATVRVRPARYAG